MGQPKRIIFDLSDVLIRGLVGIEEELARELCRPEEEILPAFGGAWLEELVLGTIPEEIYLQRIVAEGMADRARKVEGSHQGQPPPGGPRYTADFDGSGPQVCAPPAHRPRQGVDPLHQISPSIPPTLQADVLLLRPQEEGEGAEAFLEVLEALAVPPRRCLFIDDNAENVSVAESVGLPSIPFVDAEGLIAELRRRRT